LLITPIPPISSFKAPYFLTILPKVDELRPGYSKVSMNQKWIVQNHIKTVHAIAVCNLMELCMGCVAEATIPAHLRWLPKGMDVAYLKKATGHLTAIADIGPDAFNLPVYPGELAVPVEVKNSDGIVVTSGKVNRYLEPFKNMYEVD
jgi:acyl-coenzyme A thioesterase PaaI-like protein